jgi:transglutaminase-like putative cysteine protease
MTQDRRMTLTAAAAVVLVSTVMFPAFGGTVWFYAGIGATLAVASAGLLSRLRTLPVGVCLLISLIGLGLYTNLIFEAKRSIIGIIPSSSSMAALWDLTRQGFSDAGKYAAPAPTKTDLVLLAVLGIGFTAVLTDLIAVRLRSAAMAGLPLLVLFTVPVAINGNRSSLSIIVIFTLATTGYLALLSADGRERIRVWGRLISLWRSYDGEAKEAGAAAGTAVAGANGAARAVGAPDAHRQKPSRQVLRGPDTRSLAAAGRRVGLVAIVLALCTPLLIPGLHATRLTSSDWVIGPGNGNASGAGLYDPLTAAAQDLKEAKPTTVLTYSTNASATLQAYYPQYLQQYVYTTLTADNGWQQPFTTSTTTTYPFNTQLPDQATGVTNNGAPTVQMQISISKTAGFPTSAISLLPAPYPPVRVWAPGSWQYEPSTLMLLTQHGSLDGLDYTVVSHDVDPQPSALAALSDAPAMPAYTELPSSYTQSAALLHKVLSITDKAATEYGKVEAVQNWLSSKGGFIYSIYAPQIQDVSGLMNYLTKTKTGDCVQSAFAMTVMLRMIGIPARMAVGFTQGTEQTANHYVVKTSDAHAWPEVYFRGYGWLMFAPTPAGQGTAMTPGYAGGVSTGGSSTLPVISGGNTTPAGKNPGHLTGNGHIRGNPAEEGSVGIGGTAAKTSPGTPWLALALAVIAAIALACGVIATVVPASQRAATRQSGGRRRISASAVLAVLAGAGVVALALYRVLSHTKGLNLGSGWATVGIAFGAACAAALAVPVACRVVVRHWRWMRAADNDADLAHAAWEELRADLADYGIGYLPSESPRALAGRVTTGLALAEPTVEAVSRIALAEERATYAARPADADGLRRDGSTARRGIAAATGRAARLRARLFPASTMSAIADMAARIPETWTIRIMPRLFGGRRNTRPHG